MATQKTKTQATDTDVQLLTTAKCPSLSGRSEIRYSIGVAPSGDIQLKIVGSSGGGQINHAWFRFADVLK